MAAEEGGGGYLLFLFFQSYEATMEASTHRGSTVWCPEESSKTGKGAPFGWGGTTIPLFSCLDLT